MLVYYVRQHQNPASISCSRCWPKYFTLGAKKNTTGGKLASWTRERVNWADFDMLFVRKVTQRRKKRKNTVS